jgi:signal transduction histidine kinase
MNGFSEPCAFCESLPPLQTGLPHQWEFTSPDGRIITDAYDFPFRDIDGTPLILEMNIDITDYRRNEHALRESEAQARRLVEQLKAADESKNIFLNTLSHELRNPLAVIDTWLQLAESSPATIDVPKVQKILRKQVNQLAHMVEDLLDISRIMNNKVVLKKETVDINSIVEAEIDAQKMKFDTKGLTLDFASSRSPVPMQADPARITQVVGNLLHNALKSRTQAGLLGLPSARIRIARRSPSPTMAPASKRISCRKFSIHSYRQPNHWIVVSVEWASACRLSRRSSNCMEER